jgi:hypothetical protein
MASYNQAFYEDVDSTGTGHTMVLGSSDKLTNAGTITNSGTFTNSGTLANSGTLSNSATIANSSGALITFAANSSFKFTADAMTTASTATMKVRGFTTVKSTKTSKTITLPTTAMAIGETKYIFCTNATATGFVRVKAGSTAVTFDGANYCYKFLKSGHGVGFMKVSATRLMEIARTVADGTAIGSTTT